MDGDGIRPSRHASRVTARSSDTVRITTNKATVPLFRDNRTRGAPFLDCSQLSMTKRKQGHKEEDGGDSGSETVVFLFFF